LCEILRRRLGRIRVRRMAVDLRVCWMRAAMVRRQACCRRRLLVGCHGRVLR
jgi:hypothetical protein